MKMVSLTAFAALLAACFIGVAKGQTTLALKLFPDSVRKAYGAQCLDGSAAGYYYLEGSSDTFVLFLEGGGACWSADGPFSCWPRYNTSLGSSTQWTTTSVQTNNLLIRDCTMNPLFCNATFVYVPYCTGDVHSGTRQTAINETWPFHFSGHNNIQAIVDDLLNTTKIKYAKDVLVSGSSAGGFGTFFNADYVTSKLPQTRVRANPQGGFFFPLVVPYALWSVGFHGPPYAGEQEAVVLLWGAVLNPKCVSSLNASACGTVANMYKFIQTPMFISENLADSNQIFVELGCPLVSQNTTDYVQYFAKNMETALQQVYSKPADGLFAPACLAHTSNIYLQTPVAINGVRLQTAFTDWWLGGASNRVLQDTCSPVPCNPNCGSTSL